MICAFIDPQTGVQCDLPPKRGEIYCEGHLKVGKKLEELEYKIHADSFNQAVQRFDKSDRLASLTHEVAILRALLEEQLNNAKDTSSRLAILPKVSDLLKTIEKLEVRSFELERKQHQLLPKASLTKLASDIVKLLIDELCDVPGYEVKIDNISRRMLNLIHEAT